MLGAWANTHDKVQLWAGGPYWATTNIGAENPWDYGYYFWWGDTVGYRREGTKWVASDESSSDFQFGIDPLSLQTKEKTLATLQSEGWTDEDGYLATEHDAAHVHWGGEWSMPTDQDFNGLVNNCDWTFTTTNGVNGYIVRGRGEYSANSIFLPACGNGNNTGPYAVDGIFEPGHVAHYWSCVTTANGVSTKLFYGTPDSEWNYIVVNNEVSSRDMGYSIRPVQEQSVMLAFELNYEGGETVEGAVPLGRKILPFAPTPVRDGWTFVGWFTAPEGGTKLTSADVAVDGATYYAHWGNFTTVTIGSGNDTNPYLPTYSFYCYSLTQQIYTPEEIGMAGTISSIAFKNGGQEKTRTIDIYLVHTTKNSFSGSSDWISVTAEDLAFSGSVTFVAGGEWTTIAFDAPFNYNGTDNLAVIVDDNNGSYYSGMNCYVFGANAMSIRAYSDGTNFDPMNPGAGGGVIQNVKNQIKLEISSSTPEASVEQLIAAIGEVSYTDGSKAKIDAARAAYNALTTAQRALVANYATLTAAETTYAALKAAADAAVADAAAAAAVIDAIAAIGEVSYTDECRAKIDAARAAYDALTGVQKALVGNYATLTAAEAAYAALVPAPCYEVIDEADITAPYAAPKAVTLLGAAYDGCDVVGIVELKLGKVNAKKKTSKVSGSVTTLDGKKHTIKGVTVAGIDGTAPAVVSLAVKDMGTLSVTIGGTQFAGTLGGTFHVQSASVGGTWAGGTATATVEINDGDLDKFPGTLLTTLLPDGETATVKNSKWTFAKAATVKWAKAKGAAEKSLIVDTSKGKTNLSGLKLTYTPKKGTFKGSFKVYALDGSGKTVKLNKYTFNVSGFVFDGVGYGKATCKKPSVSWSVTVE